MEEAFGEILTYIKNRENYIKVRPQAGNLFSYSQVFVKIYLYVK